LCQSRGKIHQDIETEKKIQKVWGYYQLMTSTGSYLSLEAEKMALEAEGWLVKFEQRCKHCGTFNSFYGYRSLVKCKKCKKVRIWKNDFNQKVVSTPSDFVSKLQLFFTTANPYQLYSQVIILDHPYGKIATLVV